MIPSFSEVAGLEYDFSNINNKILFITELISDVLLHRMSREELNEMMALGKFN